MTGPTSNTSLPQNLSPCFSCSLRKLAPFHKGKENKELKEDEQEDEKAHSQLFSGSSLPPGLHVSSSLGHLRLPISVPADITDSPTPQGISKDRIRKATGSQTSQDPAFESQ